jgi:hypothetical protein
MMKRVFFAVFLLVSMTPVHAAEMYEIVLVQAAPGRLTDLVTLYTQWLRTYAAAAEDAPLWFRHSQGDHWDLMLVVPIGSLAAYYDPARAARRAEAARAGGLSEDEFARALSERVAWHEELYVDGPPRQELRDACADAGFYHVEMMIGLPGKRGEMRRIREQENVYLQKLGRPRNLLFERRNGASWDLVTLGCYKDIKHFVASGDTPADQAREAVRAAGFDSTEAMSLAWRSTIAMHRDTLGVAIR